MRQDITPLVLSYNEAPNIQRTLERLTWAKQVVVLDSFSTDETVQLANGFKNVRVLQRKFDEHCAQWNYGMAQCQTDWVLALDADHVLSTELVTELGNWNAASGLTGYSAAFTYCISGHELRGTLYPPRIVLFRRDSGRFEQDGHTQVVRLQGQSRSLTGKILHDDRKSLSRWLWAQDRYAELEAQKLLSSPPQQLRFQDKLRRWIIPAPILVLFYTLVLKGLILDGWPGWFYAGQRVIAEVLLSLKLIERKIS